MRGVASLQEVTQGCQGIPSCDATTLNIWSLELPQKRKKGERKKEKRLVLFPKPTPHLYVRVLAHAQTSRLKSRT